ncbi:MAG: ATP-dependent zinc metalloprotease FtsH [Fimbriimonadaceae bacterium]|nr:ATP-dependent zinc metalloprotease FtsH [Fimbriimonadaceae bacterium]
MSRMFSGTAGSLGIASQAPEELTISQLRKEVESGNISSAKWQEKTIRGEMVDGKPYVAKANTSDSYAGGELQKLLEAKGVEVTLEDAPAALTWLPVVLNLLVLLGFLFILWLMISRAAQAGGNQAMSFGRSRAKRAGENTPKITFEDVAGIDEAKAELFEVVDFLRNTKKYVALGAKIPKGILLTGPPGVGKTHLARAIAGEAGVPFFHISGSDFVEMFVGVGAARVRDLFETAKAHRPSLIFVDEIDAVGRQRGAGLGGGHDEREQTLNQLLVEMDGFDPNSGVIMIAATNRPDVLDPALLRPGRFDRQIVVDMPDAKGREQILKVHAKGKPISGDVDFETIAKRTPGFTGADLANSLNEAALLAARNDRSKIGMSDINEALDRVMAGPERRSRVVDPDERETIAIHEAGHAVVASFLEHCDPVQKVTVLPRGMSLGSTWYLPEKDTYLTAKQKLLDEITALLGGRVAEEVVKGSVTTGAYDDLRRVTAIARAMVTEYGMSERLGTLAIGRSSRNPFLGRDYVEQRNYSEEIARQVDEEVRSIVDHCHQRATDIITQYRDKLDRVVSTLLEHETIDREQFEAILAGRELPEPKPAETTLDGAPPAATDEAAVSKHPSPRLEPGTA